MEDKIKMLLEELNDIATDCDRYEYGLPLYWAGYHERMVEKIKEFVKDINN